MGAVLISLGGGGGVGSDELTATADNVLAGQKYVGVDTNDEIGTGTMPHLSNETTIDHSSSNSTPVILGDAVFVSTNSDGVNRVQIRYQGEAGYIIPNTLFGVPQSDVAAAGGLTADKMINGQYAFGIGGTIPSYSTGQQAVSSGKNDNGVYYYINHGHYRPDSSGMSWVYRPLSDFGAVPANKVVSGQTFTSTAGYKVTGTMAVTSAINFKATTLSDSAIRISWTNPSKGPWSGVFIQMSTSGYPGASGGTRKYNGTGSSSTPSGTSYVDITGLSVGTTYYFTCTSYCDPLAWGSSYNVSAKTQNIITSSTRTVTGAQYKEKDGMFQNTPSIRCWDDRGGYLLLYGNFSNKSYSLKIGTNCNGTEVSFWKSGTDPTKSSGYYWANTCHGEDGSSESVTWSGTFQANTNCIKFRMYGKDSDGNSADLHILSFTIGGIDMMSNLRSVMGV